MIRESHCALTGEQIADQLGYTGVQIGPSLWWLSQLGWASVIEYGTRRWYCEPRLRRCLLAGT